MSGNLFSVAFLIEIIIISLTRGGGRARMNDAITNFTMAAIGRIPAIFRFQMVKEIFYPMLYSYRLFDWDYYSLSHWVVAAFFVDFSYYWAHRVLHEWNIGWAAHSVHHSS